MPLFVPVPLRIDRGHARCAGDRRVEETVAVEQRSSETTPLRSRGRPPMA